MVRAAVIDDFHRAFANAEPIRRLREKVDLAIYEEPFPSQEAMVRALRRVEIIIANRERTRFTADLLAQLPELRLISNTGGHFYHVDTEAAARQGVLLCNAAGGSSQSVVELTIAFM